MNILFTVLVAFPIGLLLKPRALAVVAYLAADALLFAYQTLGVLLNWMGGSEGIGGAKAFGPFPTEFPVQYSDGELASYGLVNLVIVLAGIALTLWGTRVAGRRSRKGVVAVG